VTIRQRQLRPDVLSESHTSVVTDLMAIADLDSAQLSSRGVKRIRVLRDSDNCWRTDYGKHGQRCEYIGKHPRSCSRASDHCCGD